MLHFRFFIPITGVLVCLGLAGLGCDVTEPDLPSDLDVQLPQATLEAVDAAGADVFGSPMSLLGDRLLVSAIGKRESQGAVYVFEHQGSAWVQTGKLTPPVDRGIEWFGRAVGQDAQTIVVGAPLKNAISGAAYVFTKTDSAWTFQAELVPSDPQARDFFGWAVGVTGGSILIGAPNEAESPQREGAIYAFERTGEAWTETERLTGEAPRAGDVFGITIDVDGPQAAVGTASLFGGDKTAYVFTLEGNRWQRQARLVSPNDGVQDTFGWSVSLDGNRLAVGAPNATRDGGQAHIYERSGTTWNRQATLSPGAANIAPYFGWSVTLRENLLVVGAIGGTSTTAGGLGTAFSFRETGGAWTAVSSFAPDSSAARGATDRFGHAVQATETEVLVGAPDVASGTGAVFTFDAVQ